MSVALEAVDAGWLRDALSDDDIMVPEEHELPMDESEVDTRDALDPARASVFPDMSSFPPWVEDGSASGGGGGAGDEVEVVDAKRGDEKLLPLPETSRK